MCIVRTGMFSLPVEADVAIEIRDGCRVGRHARAGVESPQVRLQVEPGRAVQGIHLVSIGRDGELVAVIDSGVPRGIATGPQLEIRAIPERK